jgi:hypothetical protein
VMGLSIAEIVQVVVDHYVTFLEAAQRRAA